MVGMLRGYIDIALMHDLPMLSLAPTWRASAGRVARSAYNHKAKINTDCVRFLKTMAETYGDKPDHIYICGMMACRGDAYDPADALSEER